MFGDYYTTKNKSFNAILRHLRFKDDKIYFKFTEKIDIKKDDKILFIDTVLINNLSLKNIIKHLNIEFHCTILKKELNDGLEIKIEYEDKDDVIHFCKSEKQKIARYIESCIIRIDLNDELYIDTDTDFDYDNYCNNEIRYHIENDNDSLLDSINEAEENNIDDNTLIIDDDSF